MNEGLEKLGAKETINGKEYVGEVFTGSVIESIKFPSTLKRIESNTCYKCTNLQNVEIPNGVEYIGEECFKESALRSI